MIDEFDFEILKYSMNIVFLVDTSATMAGRKIDELNCFMTKAAKLMEEIAREWGIRIPIRVIEFNSEAKWLFGDAENGVEHIDWISLQANVCGYTNTSAAIDLVRSIMHRRIIGERSLFPVVVLVSDSLGTDPQKTMESIERLKRFWGRSVNPQKDNVRRIAICVDGAKEDELIEFSSAGIKPASTIGGLDYYAPLILRTDELKLFGELLTSCVLHRDPVIPATGEYDDDDWEE